MSASEHTNEVLTRDRLPARFHTFKVMVLVAGIILSLGLAYFVRGWEEALNQAEFEFLSGTHASDITKEVERHIDLMTSLVGLYSASIDVERMEFSRFVQHHLVLHTDLQMIAWVPRIAVTERNAMEAAARRDGLAGFAFTELNNEGRFVAAARRDGYFPVYFAEPQQQNSHLLGYDLASDPAMRRHLEQARDSGTWVSTDKLVFDDGGHEQYGAMLVQPVYAQDVPLASVAQRRQYLKGYLLEVFRIGDMIEEGLRNSTVRDIDIAIYDEHAAPDQRFLYRYSATPPDAEQEDLESEAPPARAEMSWRTALEVGGLRWSLVFTPAPAYLARHVFWRAWAVLIVGCFLGTLLYLYLRVLAARTRRIEQLAIELGATNTNLEHEIAGRQLAERDRQRLAAIMEATTDFVCVTDARGFILYVNQAARDLLGVAAANDLIGEHASCYHPTASNTVIKDEAIPLVRKGRIWSGETALLTRDGREIPVSQVLLPHMSAAGELEYTSTIIRDITKRKQVEAALQQEIRERRQIEAAIRAVTEVVASATGDAFFRMLVKRLTEILNVDCALIAELDEEDRGVVQTVAVCLRGDIKENFRYRLHGTISRNAMGDGLCFYERGAGRSFPEDRVLQEFAVESCLGISLLDYSGRPMGVVMVMSCAAMKSRQPAEAILQIYAARVAAELQHKKSHAQILDLVKFPDETPSPVLRIRHDGVMLYANQGSLAVVTAWDCWPGGHVPADIHELCLSALERRAVSEVDLTCGDKIFSFLLAPSSESGYVSCYGRDITERLRADAQMRKLSSALEQAADSVMITDVGGRIEYVNPAFSAMTGYSHDEAIGRRPDIIRSDRHDAEFFRGLWDTLNAGRVFQDIFVNRRKDGTLYYEEKTITPLKDAAGAVTHFISNGKDITERMQAEERLHRLAYHDVLTGLPNRALFMERLMHALSRKGRIRQLAVMFLDMDQFKTINDTLGHDVGDQLLQAFPERIAGCIRQSDTIARFGGDEFAILLEDIAVADAVGQIAAKIIERLAQPFAVGTHELFVTTSIGISLYPDDSGDVYTLLKHADSAMYRAKELGRNTYQFYSQEMSTKAYERLSLETSLRHALNRGEFELYYQPQVDLASGRVIGAEALIRWIHPEMGIISPEKFIPLLEETGMIVPVGNWVLRSACERLREWQDCGTQPLRMSVNLSGRQFHDLGFKDQIAAIIQRSGIDPGLLELEITESVLMQNDKVPMQNLHALLGLGLRFAIDDFGTGYSSLSYLKRFPVHTIKIDRSFVRDITVNSDDATIVNTIIVMAHSLKLTVVAEGVETAEQLAFLRRCGCDLMQGYLFSHPLTAAEMKRLLIDGRGLELTTAA